MKMKEGREKKTSHYKLYKNGKLIRTMHIKQYESFMIQ